MASTAAASSGQHTARVLEVVGLLYCRTVSDDYRQPVELLLPQSKQLYRSVIKSPMDLGTLLLKAYKGELSPAMLRYGLRMVFNNAIIYNSDAPLMVSYSRHLNALAKALYEEIIKEPYDGDSMAELRASGLCSPDGSPTEALGDEAFPLLLRHKRWKRFCAYKSYQLSESELNRMLGILYSPQCLVPKDLESAVEEAKVLLQNRLQEKERDADISESEETLVSMEIVLKILLTPVVTSNSSAEPNLARMLSTLPIICGTEDFCGVIPKAECKQFLVWLDELSGVLLALIEERVLRGTTYSRVWAKPHHKVPILSFLCTILH